MTDKYKVEKNLTMSLVGEPVFSNKGWRVVRIEDHKIMSTHKLKREAESARQRLEKAS